VLVNDFGAVNIDTPLIENRAGVDSEWLEAQLTSGDWRGRVLRSIG